MCCRFPGTVVRAEDNFDASSNLSVIVLPSAKTSITEYGAPEEFLNAVSERTASFLGTSRVAAQVDSRCGSGPRVEGQQS